MTCELNRLHIVSIYLILPVEAVRIDTADGRTTLLYITETHPNFPYLATLVQQNTSFLIFSTRISQIMFHIFFFRILITVNSYTLAHIVSLDEFQLVDIITFFHAFYAILQALISMSLFTVTIDSRIYLSISNETFSPCLSFVSRQTHCTIQILLRYTFPSRLQNF